MPICKTDESYNTIIITQNSRAVTARQQNAQKFIAKEGEHLLWLMSKDYHTRVQLRFAGLRQRGKEKENRMKRNCRRSSQERQHHERATRIRKMTDTQLCEYIDSLEQSHKEELRPAEIIERFICDLSESDSPRLSKGTIAKIRQIAANRGTA